MDQRSKMIFYTLGNKILEYLRINSLRFDSGGPDWCEAIQKGTFYEMHRWTYFGLGLWIKSRRVIHLDFLWQRRDFGIRIIINDPDWCRLGHFFGFQLAFFYCRLFIGEKR